MIKVISKQRTSFNESNGVKDKIFYILNNTLQREAYKRLPSNEAKVNFFTGHFIIRDHESRNLLSYFNCQNEKQFVDEIDKIIWNIERD